MDVCGLGKGKGRAREVNRHFRKIVVGYSTRTLEWK
jgi:hypothetical protein